MAKRLIKIAKELNVGLNTLVDFLNNNGFEIENKPTAKVSTEMQDALTKEFQKSIAIKERADQIKIGRNTSKREEEIASPDPVPTITTPKIKTTTAASNILGKTEDTMTAVVDEPDGVITASTSTPVLSKPKILGNIKLGNLGRKKSASSRKDKKKKTIKERSPKKEVLEEVAEKATPVSTSDPMPKQEEQATPVQEVAQDKQPALKTEKSDNAEEQSLTKPDISSKKQKEQRKKEKANHTDKKKKASVPPKQEDEPTQEASSSEVETIRADTPELRGLKIKGKIDIGKFSRSRRSKKKDKDRKDQKPSTGNRQSDNKSTDRNKQDNKSSAGSDDKKRRRRKRKKVQSDAGSANNNRSSSNSRGGGSRGGGSRGGNSRNSRNQRGGNRRSDQPREVSQKEIDEKIKATMARISGSGKRRRQKLRRENRERLREKQDLIDQEQETEVIQLTEFVSVSELASLLDISVTDVITSCMNIGVIVSINQRLDAEIIELIAEEYKREIEFISAEEQTEEEEEIIDDPEDLEPRAPIVTVMGHVDHGKTSLLDYIREAKVAAGEAGGITQHIGAYEVAVGEEDKRITFLDTPGHEAFTAMRARGAKVTDIAIIIIAADDDIMPQTKEAISHSQAAGVPMVFAINKVDKANASPEKIKEKLAGMNLLVEDWGGTYQSQDISAKTGQGIDELLEKVLLEAEILELKANPQRTAIGAILEASLDKGRGYVTKTLIQTGTLHIGDAVVAGEYSGKVKAMFNEHGKRVKQAGPSKPVLVLGLDGAPQAGERFKEMESESEARQLASKRAQINREQANRATKRISLDEIGRRLALGTFKELNLIVKGDFDGSIEALSDSLIKQSIETVQVNVIHKAVGQIIESDVLLASASDAIIVGFQVRPSLNARRLAEKEGVQIRTYSIIYEAINEVRSAIEGMLEPTKEERIVCNVEVRDVFKISKVGTIAGCYVQDGKITRNTHVRLIRDGIVIYPTKEGVTGEIASLRRLKDDVKEVKSGLECGINIKNFNDIKVGDIIEGYDIIEVKQTLD
ncbi:MAG: translation initiation factor IF-2 [Bacteroidota bacterium]